MIKNPWGLPLLENTVIGWGARAILQNGAYIDLLPDRQSADKSDDVSDSDMEEFFLWVNNKGLPMLRGMAKEYIFSPSKAREYILKEGHYYIKANTHGSYGYLYISAGKTLDGKEVEFVNHVNDSQLQEGKWIRFAKPVKKRSGRTEYPTMTGIIIRVYINGDTVDAITEKGIIREIRSCDIEAVEE